MHLPKFLAILVFCAVLACAVAISAGAHTRAQADTATPTPSPPAPTPTAVPALTSGIKVTYTIRGIPSIVVTGHLHIAFVNGDTRCAVLATDIVYEALSDGTPWPWGLSGRNPPICNQPGVSVRICRTLTSCSDEFTYTGADVSVNLPVTGLPADTPLAIAHFVHEGVSQTVSVTGWLFESGGYLCSFGGKPLLPAVVSEVAHIWPTISQCSPPGQDVHVTFNTAEFGDLHATFQWNSGDVNYDVDTGAFLQTPTPSPTATPGPTLSATPQASVSPTPAQLPQSGGPPPGNPSAAPFVAVATVVIAARIVAWLVAARRRKT